MKANRILTVLIVFACVLATVVALRPRWLGCQWSRSGSGPVIRMIIPPDEMCVSRTRRLLLKGQALLRLRDGDLTLFETAAVFGHLNALPPARVIEDTPRLSGADEGERLCRQVIQWAESEWEGHLPAEELKARLDRLVGELERHIAAHGGVRLPTDTM